MQKVLAGGMLHPIHSEAERRPRLVHKMQSCYFSGVWFVVHQGAQSMASPPEQAKDSFEHHDSPMLLLRATIQSALRCCRRSLAPGSVLIVLGHRVVRRSIC